MKGSRKSPNGTELSIDGSLLTMTSSRGSETTVDLTPAYEKYIGCKSDIVSGMAESESDTCKSLTSFMERYIAGEEIDVREVSAYRRMIGDLVSERDDLAMYTQAMTGLF